MSHMKGGTPPCLRSKRAPPEKVRTGVDGDGGMRLNVRCSKWSMRAVDRGDILRDRECVPYDVDSVLCLKWCGMFVVGEGGSEASRNLCG